MDAATNPFAGQFAGHYKEASKKMGRFNLAIFGKTGVGKSTESPWFRWRLALLDFDQGLVGPFRSVEDGFELCGR